MSVIDDIRALGCEQPVDDDRFVRPVDIGVTVEETDVMTDIENGFRMECFGGTAAGVPVQCSTGGGCGSPWVTFSVGDRYFRIDLREVAKSLAALVIDSSDTVSVVGGVR